MKAFALGMVAVGLIAVSACSGATPASDCNRVSETICHRAFTCSATQAAQLYVTESNCVTQWEAQLNCASLVCPANTTYHDDKVNACISAVNAQTCADTTSPPACQGFATSTVCY